MRWTIVHHPEAGAAVIAEPALISHITRGWSLVGDWHEDPELLRGQLVAAAESAAEPISTVTPQVTMPSKKEG